MNKLPKEMKSSFGIEAGSSCQCDREQKILFQLKILMCKAVDPIPKVKLKVEGRL